MATGTAGNSARVFPWQVTHYIVRGGPNDPVVATTPAVPAAQTGGGSLSYNTAITLPPVPGQSATRTMTFNSTGTLTAGQLVTNSGGIYIGTIPQGAVITDILLHCYAALSVGTSTSVGVFYTASPSVTVYPVATMNLLAYITTPAAATTYRAITSINTTAFTAANAAPGPCGFGTPTTAGAIANLASLTDIDIYVASFLTTGTGTASSTGVFACMVQFTGLEG